MASPLVTCWLLSHPTFLVSNRIRHLRELRAWSLDELAKAAGTTNQQVSLLETGKRRLTVEWLYKLSAALGCHPWELIEERGAPGLGDAEIHLLRLFSSLGPQQQRALLGFLRAVAEPQSA